MKKIAASNGRTLIRRSRWIKVRTNYNPSKRNRLWYYVNDGNGRREGQTGCDPSSGLYLDWFPWNGRKWAMDSGRTVGRGAHLL